MVATATIPVPITAPNQGGPACSRRDVITDGDDPLRRCTKHRYRRSGHHRVTTATAAFRNRTIPARVVRVEHPSDRESGVMDPTCSPRADRPRDGRRPRIVLVPAHAVHIPAGPETRAVTSR
ncbi:hypothetical protein GCM10009772_25310 [Pseudonocardia alni subsp. carboxydivorans]